MRNAMSTNSIGEERKGARDRERGKKKQNVEKIGYRTNESGNGD